MDMDIVGSPDTFCSVFSLISEEEEGVEVVEWGEGDRKVDQVEELRNEEVGKLVEFSKEGIEMVAEEVPLLEEEVNIGNSIGEGSSGKVYRGKLVNGSTICAVKVFSRKIPVFDAVNEYLTLKKVTKSEYIVKVYGIYVNKDREIAIAIEYCSTIDVLGLVSGIRRYGLQVKEGLVSGIIERVVNGIKYLHLHNIVHRDIKPENILIDSEGKIRLCDFGYAIDLERMEDYPWGEMSFRERGTGSFRGPEVINGEIDGKGEESKKMLKAADVWALAMVWFQMTFMRRPWDEASLKDKNFKKFKEKYESCRGQAKWVLYKKLLVLLGMREDDGIILLEMVDPDWKNRICIEEVSRSEWAFRTRAGIGIKGVVESEILRITKMIERVCKD